MKAQSPPTKIPRRADTGVGLMGLEEGGGSPSTGLWLGLGSGSGPRPGLAHSKSSSLTFLQLQELEHQALIFKYMIAGLPVPFHLVLPIWKSVASSLDGVNGGFNQHYPSFLACSPLSFDYRHNMEPEPGRCRRTDGKKWRCSKDVVPDQKYCERHMHRGRQRSRKHVEASKTSTASASSSTTTTTTTTTTPISTSDSVVVDSNTNLSISIPVSPQLLTNSSRNNHNHNNSSCNASPGLGFFRKSVLQVLGSSSPWYDCKNSMETEPGRCRRTDGRKWRCFKDVVLDQKYCERHMHRGSRKHVEASRTTPITTIVTTTTITSTTSPANAAANNAESLPNNGNGDCVNTNSKLSISMAVSPLPITNNNNIDDRDSSNASPRLGSSPKSVLSSSSKS